MNNCKDCARESVYTRDMKYWMNGCIAFFEPQTPDNIIQISKEQYLALLDSGMVTHKYTPLGQFWLKEGDKFIGVDNSTGDAWVEEFASFADCKDWML